MGYNISWSSYWTTIVIILLLYYSLILILYFRKELSRIILGSRNATGSDYLTSPVNNQTVSNKKAQNENSKNFGVTISDSNENTSVVPLLLFELHAYLEQAGQSGINKPELLNSIHQLLKKYPANHLTKDQVAINNFLQKNCEEKCLVLLDENELNSVWSG